MAYKVQTAPHQSPRMLIRWIGFSAWMVGVLVHLLFQLVYGSWYDGLVYALGFPTAAWVFIVTFFIATAVALMAESQFERRATLTRCIVHLAIGMLVIPAVLVLFLMVLKPELTAIQLGTIAGMELFFSIASRSPLLLGFALAYEVFRRRS